VWEREWVSECVPVCVHVVGVVYRCT